MVLGTTISIPAKIVYVRNTKKKKDWVALISTNTNLSEEDIIRIYGKRWQTEVFYKTCKSWLKLGKECHGLSYDALTAHVSLVFTRYMLISGFIGNPNIWLMEEKSSHEPIGYVSVDIPYDILGIGEIAYLLGDKYQHRGYASEAMEAIIAYLFMERKLYMIEAKYNEDNVASGNLLKRLGFQVYGILRDRRIDRETGKRSSLVVCSITQNDYSK